MLIENYDDTLRGHRVLHLVGKGNKPATMPLTVPVLASHAHAVQDLASEASSHDG